MTEPAIAPSPAWRVVLAIAAIVAGIVLVGVIGAAVVSVGGWSLDVSAAIGAEIGRAAGQIAAEVPLDDHRMPIGAAVMLNVPLWACMVGAPLWGRARGIQWRRDLRWGMRRSDIGFGLGIGVGTQLVLIPLVYGPIFWIFGEQDVSAAARDIMATVDTGFDVAALAILTVVGAPVAEEVLFRGLLYRGLVDLQADWGRFGTALAVVASSAVFAAVHFQLLQFPGLMVFGIVAAVTVMKTGRLGTAIFTHVGFNLATVSILLLERF